MLSLRLSLPSRRVSQKEWREWRRSAVACRFIFSICFLCYLVACCCLLHLLSFSSAPAATDACVCFDWQALFSVCSVCLCFQPPPLSALTLPTHPTRIIHIRPQSAHKSTATSETARHTHADCSDALDASPAVEAAATLHPRTRNSNPTNSLLNRTQPQISI